MQQESFEAQLASQQEDFAVQMREAEATRALIEAARSQAEARCEDASREAQQVARDGNILRSELQRLDSLAKDAWAEKEALLQQVESLRAELASVPR
jgi:hypothetical protein